MNVNWDSFPPLSRYASVQQDSKWQCITAKKIHNFTRRTIITITILIITTHSITMIIKNRMIAPYCWKLYGLLTHWASSSSYYWFLERTGMFAIYERKCLFFPPSDCLHWNKGFAPDVRGGKDLEDWQEIAANMHKVKHCWTVWHNPGQTHTSQTRSLQQSINVQQHFAWGVCYYIWLHEFRQVMVPKP